MKLPLPTHKPKAVNRKGLLFSQNGHSLIYSMSCGGGLTLSALAGAGSQKVLAYNSLMLLIFFTLDELFPHSYIHREILLALKIFSLLQIKPHRTIL